jgi:hypothetical protein
MTKNRCDNYDEKENLNEKKSKELYTKNVNSRKQILNEYGKRWMTKNRCDDDEKENLK